MFSLILTNKTQDSNATSRFLEDVDVRTVHAILHQKHTLTLEATPDDRQACAFVATTVCTDPDAPSLAQALHPSNPDRHRWVVLGEGGGGRPPAGACPWRGENNRGSDSLGSDVGRTGQCTSTDNVPARTMYRTSTLFARPPARTSTLFARLIR